MNVKIKKVMQFVLTFLFALVLIGCTSGEKIIVDFDSNGGTYVSFIEIDLEKIDEFKLPEDPTKDGYVFGGWYLEKGLVNEFTSLSGVEEKITLYAKWNEAEVTEITVTFNSNGGTLVEEMKVSVADVDSFALPTAPTLEGKEFGGWYLDTKFTTPFTKLATDKSQVTLYAKWNTPKVTEVTVKYNTNGAAAIADDVVKAEEVSGYALPTEPTLEGKVFGGWFVDAGFNIPFTQLTADAKEVTLYAKWNDKVITEVKVNYDSKGGTAVASETVSVSEVDAFTLPSNPTRDGYEFAGWFMDSAYQVPFVKLTPYLEEVNLYAKWEFIIISVSIDSEKDSVKVGETLKLEVIVDGTSDQSHTWTVSVEDIVAINDNDELTVVGDIKVDVIVTITATSTVDATATASKTIIVIAPVVEGSVGELSSEMLKALGNQSITVIGTLTDTYQDFRQTNNSSVREYDMLVEMSEGAWSGSWNVKGNTGNVITDVYRKGSVDGLRDQYGNVGHGLERLYIDKNNKVASKVEIDYLSIPSIWEAQHLWNHIGNLDIKKFTYDAQNKVYKYNIDLQNADDLYLMTYLSYSLTPVLADTLVELYLTVEDGKITGLIGQTEKLYYGSDTEEDPDALSYSTINLTFDKIGTTVVSEPQPYAAPQYGDVLAQALKKIFEAKNYTFQTTDTQTYAPSVDSGDYEIESVGSSARSSRAAIAFESKVYNNVSEVGTVGCFGQVTNDAILLANTTKYSMTLDGKAYHTVYSGYKQIDSTTFDYFEYNSKTNNLEGTKKYNGSIFDVMPTFDFSANIFRFAGQTIDANGKALYTFVLNETSIMREVAMELSAYNYADDAEASSSVTLQIVVDDAGNLVSSVFPYSISSGTYLGYCTTTYSKIGETILDEDLFDGYVPRVLKTSWSQYMTKYFSTSHSTLDSHEEDTSVVLEAIFGEKASLLPPPDVFMNILGDNINGPFYDWDEKGTDANGNPIYVDSLSITTISSEYDENGNITNYEELMEQLQIALAEYGFQLSPGNTDISGGASGRSTRYVCFISDDIQIVIENNFTKYLWISFYNAGDWKLNR